MALFHELQERFAVQCKLFKIVKGIEIYNIYPSLEDQVPIRVGADVHACESSGLMDCVHDLLEQALHQGLGNGNECG